MNILVTGSKGYIGSSIIKKNNNKNNYYFEGSRENINILNRQDIIEYIKKNKIDAIIHCAIKGGSRIKKDDLSDFYENLLIAENVLSVSKYVKKIINLASGAEFDRSNDIFKYPESEIFNRNPQDYYGLAKNIIAKRFYSNDSNTFNIRVFGCFDENELKTRFIKTCIINNLTNQTINIYEDKIMDFIYMDDLIKIIDHFLVSDNLTIKDLNACYNQKLKLSEIAFFVNNISNIETEIKIEKLYNNLNYCGCPKNLESLKLKLTGLTTGIIKTYNIINENIYRWT